MEVKFPAQLKPRDIVRHENTPAIVEWVNGDDIAITYMDGTEKGKTTTVKAITLTKISSVAREIKGMTSQQLIEALSSVPRSTPSPKSAPIKKDPFAGMKKREKGGE
jgi:hypothetical protein